jgi:hypothetical protein
VTALPSTPQPPTRVGAAAPAELDALIVGHAEGLRLRGSALWFDCETARELCFISHALVRRARQHSRTLTSPLSELLLRALHGAAERPAARRRLLAVPLRQRFAIGELSLELLPSGYLLGSCSILVEWCGKRVLYSGPLTGQPNPLAEPPEPKGCDLLLLKTPTACRVEHAPASFDEQWPTLQTFIEESFATGSTPVLACSPVGTAQFVAGQLIERGLALRVHPQIRAVSGVYADQGYGLTRDELGQLKRYASASGLDPKRRPEVLLWPAQLTQSRSLRHLPQVRVKALVDSPAWGAKEAKRARAALVAYARACAPRHVLIYGTPSAALVGELQATGATVSCRQPSCQLEMF